MRRGFAANQVLGVAQGFARLGLYGGARMALSCDHLSTSEQESEQDQPAAGRDMERLVQQR
jgi:hypothetical protein